MTAHFDILARRYRRYAEITDLLYRPWLTGVVGDGARALDLGCGSGRYSGLLADRYTEVLAVDRAAREIALAEADNARPDITYQARDLFDVTPDRDGRFDLVLAVNTLFAVRDYGRVLPHVRSLIAPCGRLVVIDVVNPPGRRPSWHRAQAFRVAAMMAVRHRSPAVALDVLRLRLHPTWLAHVTRNAPPTRDECHAHYRQAFPGARLDDTLDRHLCGVVWNAPA